MTANPSAQLKLAEPEVENPEAAVRLAPERPEDAPAVMALVARAFGPGRYAKVSERVREGNQMIPALSFCAFGAGDLVGTVRLWPIEIGGSPGLFLGPIAVEAAWRKHGVGGQLVKHFIETAEAAGETFVLLVGDLGFFGPYGFAPVQPFGRIVLPSPVDPRRVLWRPLKQGGTDGVAGAVNRPGSGHG